VTEIDPICALQAAMEGYRVVTMEYAADKADIFVTATGNYDVITHDHMQRMKDQAIVCNIGHFDNEIDVASLEKLPAGRRSSRRSTMSIFPDGKRIILLAKGRLVNLGCGTGHPSYVMSSSFANQTIAQIELFDRDRPSTRSGSTCCPSTSTRRSPRLQLKKLGAQLTELTDAQAQLHRRRQGRALQAGTLPVLKSFHPRKGSPPNPGHKRAVVSQALGRPRPARRHRARRARLGRLAHRRPAADRRRAGAVGRRGAAPRLDPGAGPRPAGGHPRPGRPLCVAWRPRSWRARWNAGEWMCAACIAWTSASRPAASADCLLQAGAASLPRRRCAGRDQLHAKIREDARNSTLEGVNARRLSIPSDVD
jgi:hypothetical protein